ncbi:MAG: hypothetical protein PVF43_07685, partial [Candidatus Eiseniibacteriota bacterium]
MNAPSTSSTIRSGSAPRRDRVDRFYQLVTNEEDARVCKEISDEACRYVPRNFFRILVTQTLTSLGDLLASPKTVL